MWNIYFNAHMPLTIGVLGSALKAVSVEIGLLGGNRTNRCRL